MLRNQIQKFLNRFCLFLLFTSCAHDVKSKKEFVSISKLKVPKGMIYISQVLVSKAMVREGPSQNFPIKDKMIFRMDKIIIHDYYKDWVRIFSLKNQKFGWVHKEMISTPWKNRKPYIIPQKALKVSYARKDILKGHSYLLFEPLDVKIRKGTPVFVLMNQKDKVLSWLPKIKKVMWLPQSKLDL